ncbi:MAG: hypothetical protein GWP59_08465 [Chlamydiales bacterium]|jgi:hypothetical protein|nr:hypothetical protein [Chlamydiales bacterium]
MTEKELISLGFEKHIEEDPDGPFYYYTLDIVEGLYCITDASDEAAIENDEWSVELSFDCNPRIKFKDVKSLTELVNLLNQNKDEDKHT